MIHLRHITYACEACRRQLHKGQAKNLNTSTTWQCDGCNRVIDPASNELLMTCNGRSHKHGYHVCQTCCMKNQLWSTEFKDEIVEQTRLM